MAQEPSPDAGGYERLGRYEILGEIASGGMATVYLGRVTGAKGFQRLVAIKRLHPHLAGEEDFVAMFLDEARLAARIRHQNVVATLDVDDHDGHYIVMEYIEGDRLLGLLRHASKTGERIPPTVALRIALDTLAGLHAAHELREDDGELIGLVHRDVSPQNILIGIDGVARLTDFGIAKATSRLTVTRDGQLKGKIAYMAPEQTKRIEIDRRVDLFAMGIITWEMLTSKKLFTGDSDVEVLNQLLFEPIPRLRDHAPGLPAALDAAVMKALERDPAKRFNTASEFADALERASKVFGGAANARAVAAYVQKVAGDKLARDRAKVTGGTPVAGTDTATPSRVTRKPTGPVAQTHETIASFDGVPASEAPRQGTARALPPANPAPAPGQRVGKSTMVGMPAVNIPVPAVGSGPQQRSRAANPPATVPTPGAVGTMAPVASSAPAPPAARPSAPVITPGPSLIDDDEDVPTQAFQKSHMSGYSAPGAGDDLTIVDEAPITPPITSGPAVPAPPVSGGTRAGIVAPPPSPSSGSVQRPSIPAPPPVARASVPPPPVPAPSTPRPAVPSNPPAVAHTSPLPPAVRASAPTASLPVPNVAARAPTSAPAMTRPAVPAPTATPAVRPPGFSLGDSPAASAPTVNLPPEDAMAPRRGRGLWIVLGLVVLGGGGVAAWQFVIAPRLHPPAAPVATEARPRTTPPVIAPAPFVPPAPPSTPPPTPTPPAQNTAANAPPAPTPNPPAPAGEPGNGAGNGAPTPPTPPAQNAAANTVANGAASAPHANTPPSESPRVFRPVHRGGRGVPGASSGSGPAASPSASGSNSGNPTPPPPPPPRPRPSGGDDDPFGSSNPYQR